MTTKTQIVEHRPFSKLGKADHGWLNANHHFSFASYRDQARMGWGNIRVWNDDEIAPHSGFDPHDHDNMEIITYVREGAITHKDSMGNVGRTEAGDVQVMSAGTGITHSEFNLEDTHCRLFQIWVLPRTRNIAPRWDQRQFPEANSDGAFTILASGYGDKDALEINADARVLGAKLAAGDSIEYLVEAAHHAYLVPAKGRMRIDGLEIAAGDGIAILPGLLTIEAIEATELVMVDSV
jgi:quercetin 2,3-dioxygenase